MDHLHVRHLCKDIFYGAVRNHIVAYTSDWKLHLYDAKLCEDVAVADLMGPLPEHDRYSVAVCNILVQDECVLVYFAHEHDHYFCDGYDQCDFFVKRTYTLPNLEFCEDDDDRFYDRENVPENVCPENLFVRKDFEVLFHVEEAKERGVAYHNVLFTYGEPLPGLRVFHPWVEDTTCMCYFQSAYSTSSIVMEDVGNYCNEIYTFDDHSVLISFESGHVVHVRLEDTFAHTYFEMLYPLLTSVPKVLVWMIATYLGHVQVK